MTADPIFCGDGCKRHVDTEEAAMAAAWSFLAVVRRWRCPACATVLRSVVDLPPNNAPSVDPLKPDDRGALPMPKGFGIVPVAVKG